MKIYKGLALFWVLTFAIMPLYVMAKEDKDSKDKGEEIKTARRVFEKLDCQALEILSPSTRLDMLDYWDADSVYKASNEMEGLSWLESLSDNYLKLRITAVSSLEIKILPCKKENIVMTIYTVGNSTQAQDSQIDFYDSQLEKIETSKHFDMPELKEFFEIPKGSLTSMKEIRQMIPFPTVAYSASADNDDLTARLTVEEFVNLDDWNIIKLFLKPEIKAEWKKEKYKF